VFLLLPRHAGGLEVVCPLEPGGEDGKRIPSLLPVALASVSVRAMLPRGGWCGRRRREEALWTFISLGYNV
jgi:hypothetical protein